MISNSWAAAGTDLQDPLKGAQYGKQGWGTLCSGKNCKTTLEIDISRRFYEPNSCISSYLKTKTKTLTPLAVTSLWLAASRCRNAYLIAGISPSLKSYITLISPPTYLEKFLRTMWNAVSQAIVFILLQIMLNLHSHVMLCFVLFCFVLRQQEYVLFNIQWDSKSS